MPFITVRDKEPLDSALRRFKRLCERSGILSELRRRTAYEKPSVRRKRKEIMARKKLLKKIAKEKLIGAA